MQFDHEKLDVYRTTLQFIVLANRLTADLPPGHAYLVDQLRRASSSITFNTAEGAGEFSPAEKVRFYRMAKRSATECAAILDVFRELEVGDRDVIGAGRGLLIKVVSMLVKLCKGRVEG